jgi:hypothetical protein
MPFPFLVQLAISVALQVIGYLLLPKPPKEVPPELTDFEDPTAEGGRPIPVVWGSGTITGLNILDYKDKSIGKRQVKVSKK